MEWYTVKLLYRLMVSGDPDRAKLDARYTDNRLYFRESMLLVKADSVDHAFVLAANTAKSNYERYQNRYSQTVTSEFDRTIDCFRLSDMPGSFAEVYSSVFPAHVGENTHHMLMKRYEPCPPDMAHALRRQ
jgi:hypothetical protein